MSLSALWPVQEAIYARLNGDATLLGLATGGVHDQVPGQQSFPYVVIGDATEEPDHAHDQDGNDQLADVFVRSRYPGFKEALTIAQRIDVLLDNHLLVVAGWGTITVQREMRQAFRDPTDGVTRIVLSRYRVGTFAP